ncbi:MAG TPA: aldehyde ferredoxin oxidoreductase family protein [Caldilineae bacterium]|nr:aldehyde ferredoxin oxidoreductase family protein [Caldilineae bacterium]
MPYGFHNKILRVNLSTGEISTEQPGEKFFRTYFGGWGLIAYYLLKELEPGIDPLGPDNILIFAPGVTTGIPIGGGGRNAVGAKSPLTGGFGEADVGGFWGAELKHAGWDAIIITGQAEKPVYLWIKDDQVEIRDASHLWGKPTAEVEEIIKDELGEPRARIAQCGLAGENLVRFACVINDINRAAGRTGMGAVMGSKKLKAIAVRGTGQLPLADREKVMEIGRWLREHFKEEWTGDLHEHGTDGGLIFLNESGGLPTRNFQEGSFEGAQKITGETMTNTILVARDTCYACPVTCKRKVKADNKYKVDPIYGGPEYETAGSLGSVCGIDDLEAIAYGNQLCNAYGMDTISAGVTIAWAMECFERGLLTKEDTGGLDLHFGNAEAMITLLEQIAHREGFGDLLAEGSLRAAQKIGRGTEKYAMHVKGQEVPMHEPRIKFALDLGYATSPTGADHMHNIHDTSYESEGKAIQDMRSLGILDPLPADTLGIEKVRLAKYHIDWQVFWNCMGLCMFMPYSKEQMRDIVRGVTGWNSSIFELMKVGERALAMARAFNYREGFTAKDDVAPWRFSTPFESGPAKGVAVPAKDIQKAIELYYEMNGWDKETGAPTAGKLHELGLSWVADLLYGS